MLLIQLRRTLTPALLGATFLGSALLGATCPGAALGAARAEEGSGAVDDSALRYYANHNESERYQAELRRLTSLYPDWTPPTDLSENAPDPEAPLWKLFAANDLDGLEAEVLSRQKAHPGFALSADLSSKLALKLARRDLLAADAANSPEAVLTLAVTHPELGGCADLDVAWRIAAANAASNRSDAALAAYAALVDTCGDADKRYATLQKAIDRLGAAAVPLLEKAEAEKGGERFADLEAALVRREIAATLADPAHPAFASPMRERFETAALKAGPSADAALIGWARRAAGDGAGALGAFEVAATLLGGEGGSAGDAAKVSEGIVLSLVDLDRRDEAFARARDQRRQSPELAGLFLRLGAARFEGAPRPRLPDADIASYADAVHTARSAAGAETLGWYAFDFKQYGVAKRWFALALDIEPSEAAAQGLIFATGAGGDAKSAQSLAATWKATFPALVAFRTGRPAKPVRRAEGDAVLASFQARDYGGCVERALARQAKGPLPPATSLIAGWCLLKLDRPSEAALAFRAAEAGEGSVRDDAVYGRSLALMAAGDVRGAVEKASAGSMTTERRDEIGVAVLADQAAAAFNAHRWKQALAVLDERRRYGSESQDLGLMRGWSLWHLNRRAEAKRVFAALDRTLSTRRTRAALATVRQADLD